MVLEACTRPLGPVDLPAFADTDPLTDDDEALALYLCYELHYQGLPGCDPEWEWEPSLLELRKVLERRYLNALREHLPHLPQGERACRVVSLLAGSPGRSLSHYLEHQGTLAEFREFAIHRSAYQLKEADPHTWAIPRLTNRSKAALVFIQFEEYGEGVPAEMHSALFARTMDALGLNSDYGHYVDHLPGITLSSVNLVSLFGLHRRWRGALIGHLALFEMVSTKPNASYARGLRRLGIGEDATRFFDAHVVADSIHEVIALEELLGGLVESEETVEPDIAFGAQALAYLDGMVTDHLLDSWEAHRSSLVPSVDPPLERETLTLTSVPGIS